MTKRENIENYFSALNKNLDETFSIFQIKLAGLYEINRINENYHETIGVTNADNPSQIVHVVEITSQKLKSHYTLLETESRRAYISDLYSLVARYSIIIRSIINDNKIVNPEFSDKVNDQALKLLYKFIKPEDKLFLDFFHLVRNSIIHYDGNYNKRNKLDYIFNNNHFLTNDASINKQIIWSIDDLLNLYTTLKKIYDFRYFFQNTSFKTVLI